MAFVPILRKIRRQSKKLFVLSLIITIFTVSYLTLPDSLLTNNQQVLHHNLQSRQSVLQSNEAGDTVRSTHGVLEWGFRMGHKQEELLNENRNLLETNFKKRPISEQNKNKNVHKLLVTSPNEAPSIQSLISRKGESTDSDIDREKIQHFKTHPLTTDTKSEHFSRDRAVQHVPEDDMQYTMDELQRKREQEHKFGAAINSIVRKVEDRIMMTEEMNVHDENVRAGDVLMEHQGVGGELVVKKIDSPEPVLDAENLKIMPKRPIVPEGHTLQITCAIISLLKHGKAQDAPHLTFELPPMTPLLLGKVHMIVRPGVASLRFTSVHRGHEGTYRCKAVDAHERVTYNTVEVRVIKNDKTLDYQSEEDMKNLMWAQHSMFGDPKHSDRRNGHNSVEMKALQKKKRRKPREPEPDLETIRNVLGNKDELAQVNITQLLERGKFQEQQVEKFCHRFQLDHIKLKLPESNQSNFGLYRHLLLNELTETLFCFMPKVGCTNLRVLFFVVQGFIPLSQLLKERDSVDQNRLESAQYTQSFLSRNDIQRTYALKKYYKFIMYRNPLERLVSGYRSKVQRFPLQGLRENVPHYNFLRKEVLLWANVTKYSDFIHNRGKMSINITFSNFIDYWVRQRDTIRYNEHFRSIFRISQPCRVRYHFYGNFKQFETDAQVLVNKIGAKPEYIRSGYYDDTKSTEKLTPSYYAQLTDEQKRAVLNILAVDLEFYYSIFPEERGVHKTILGIDDELELPEAITMHYREVEMEDGM